MREERLNGPGFAQNLRIQGQYLTREQVCIITCSDTMILMLAGLFARILLGSRGVNLYQYAPNELNWVDPLGLSKCKPEIKELDPKDIRFSQSSVNDAADLTHSIKTKGWAGDLVDVVRMSDSKLTTIDNTRILAASRADLKVQARIHEGTSSLPNEFINRFTTKKVFLLSGRKRSNYELVNRLLDIEMDIQMVQLF